MPTLQYRSWGEPHIPSLHHLLLSRKDCESGDNSGECEKPVSELLKTGVPAIVTASIFLIAGCVIAFIVIRRRKQSKLEFSKEDNRASIEFLDFDEMPPGRGRAPQPLDDVTGNYHMNPNWYGNRRAAPEPPADVAKFNSRDPAPPVSRAPAAGSSIPDLKKDDVYDQYDNKKQEPRSIV